MDWLTNTPFLTKERGFYCIFQAHTTEFTNADFYGVELASVMEFANFRKARNVVYLSYNKDLR